MMTSAQRESGDPDDTIRTIDHDEIQQWAEARDGRPSIVAAAQGEEGSILRIDLGTKETNLEEISWKEFFRIFEESDLAFIYQEHTADGEPSFFCKFAAREPEDEDGREDSPDSDAETDEEDDADEELEDNFNDGDE